MDGKKILVVDDDAVFLKLIENDLTKGGYSVTTVNNGKDAIDLAKLDHPNLILLDVSLPGMDGRAITSVLENEPETKNIPIVYVTALITEEEAFVSGHSKGKHFIAKPYNSNNLLAQVEKYIA